MSSTPRFTSSASCIRCMLQGFPSYQTELMPTCGLFMSSSRRPVAYSIACDAPWDLGCVMRELYLLRPAGRQKRASWRRVADDRAARAPSAADPRRRRRARPLLRLLLWPWEPRGAVAFQKAEGAEPPTAGAPRRAERANTGTASACWWCVPHRQGPLAWPARQPSPARTHAAPPWCAGCSWRRCCWPRRAAGAAGDTAFLQGQPPFQPLQNKGTARHTLAAARIEPAQEDDDR